MDGRRLYGPYDATRSLAWGLDVCNGRWELDGRNNGTVDADLGRFYTYRATPSFPYLVGCVGPAGIPLGVPEVVETATSLTYSISLGKYIVEDSYGGCPAGSVLSVDTGECEVCRAGTYQKEAGSVGVECSTVRAQQSFIQITMT